MYIIIFGVDGVVVFFIVQVFLFYFLNLCFITSYLLAFWGRAHQQVLHTSLGEKNQVLHPHKTVCSIVLERHFSV
jgi:hypothetical protein